MKSCCMDEAGAEGSARQALSEQSSGKAAPPGAFPDDILIINENGEMNKQEHTNHPESRYAAS